MKKYFSIVFVVVFISSCGGEIKNVSFKNDVVPIIDNSCIDCHNSDQNMGGLNFETYNSLMESRYLNRSQPLVIKGDASQSRLYLVTHANDPLIRMPPKNYGYDHLDDDEIETIKVWINEGAKNN